uniref:Uncharacterized protein n=1 Tax=Anguilla anguilla TaxID=7936 RepID=A0A0E9XH65_ANGAN
MHGSKYRGIFHASISANHVQKGIVVSHQRPRSSWTLRLWIS